MDARRMFFIVTFLSAIPIPALAALADCPDPAATPPYFYAYQSDIDAVELVVSDCPIGSGACISSGLAGADHYEIRRSKVGTVGDVLLVPQKISAATSSITDRNQGLEDVSELWVPQTSYAYTLTVMQTNGTPTQYAATVVDVARDQPTVLGDTLLLGHTFGPVNSGPVGGGPDVTLSNPPYYDGFLAPFNRTYAKYIGTARSPSDNSALPCVNVSIVDSQTGAQPTLFADRYGRFVHPNPMVSDRHGRFEFFADQGVYDIQVGGPSGYVQAGVTVYDPRGAHTAHADGDAAAFTMVTSSAPSNGDGNISLAFNRGGFPGRRLLTDDAVHAWAMTYNARWHEGTRGWTLDAPAQPALFMRIHGPTAALEYGLDQAYGLNDGEGWIQRPSAQFETFVHIGPDRAHLKSTPTPVTIEAIAAEAGMFEGQIVHMNPDQTVSRTLQAHELHPFVLRMVHEPDHVTRIGSRVYLTIAGRVDAITTSSTIEYQPGDVFISGPDGRAELAPGETDSRYIVGYSRIRNQGWGWVTLDVR